MTSYALYGGVRKWDGRKNDIPERTAMYVQTTCDDERNDVLTTRYGGVRAGVMNEKITRHTTVVVDHILST